MRLAHCMRRSWASSLMQELHAQRESDAASKGGEAFVDYSKSAAQNVADMAAAAKPGATRAANKAQPYVDSAAEQARAGLGRAAEAGQSAAQQASCKPFSMTEP